jgi:hypothetical protein
MNYIDCKYGGARYVFTSREFSDLLKDRPDIWEQALKRGKAFNRSDRMGERT